jgi:hypothetical protein
MNRPVARALRRLSGRVSGRRASLRAAREERHLLSALSWDPTAPALLLSPHWDDAVLSCWSLLSGAGELAVANVFAGVPPPGRSTVWTEVLRARDTAERARWRMAEDAQALARAGREPINLPLLEARPQGASRVSGLEEIDRALCAVLTSASHVYVPAGIGSHVDHLLTRRYGQALARHGVPVSLYAELPYCVFHGWPRWIAPQQPGSERDVDAYWRSCLAGVAEMPPLREAHVLRLDAERARDKAAAIECYQASLNESVRRLLADPAFHAIEVRWALGAGAGEPPEPVAET